MNQHQRLVAVVRSQVCPKTRTAAMEELLSLVWSHAKKRARRKVPDGDDCEDIAAIACRLVWERLDTYTDRGRGFIRWVDAIVTNTINDYYRQRRRPDQAVADLAVDQADRSAASSTTSECRVDLDIAMKQLTPPIRQMFLLYYEDGWTLQQIAAKLNIPQSVVFDKLHKAKAQLRRSLAT